VGPVAAVECIAKGRGIKEVSRLRRVFGPGHWRKMKGIATVRLPDGSLCTAEVHWYEAHGIGRCEMKLKRVIGEAR
jgi:hypothetical protein